METRVPKEVDRLIGDTIAKRRDALKLSKKDMAGALGISSQQLTKYELGENRIAASRLMEIADLLQIPVASLFQTACKPTEGPDPLGRSEQQELDELFTRIKALDRAERQKLLRVLRAKAASSSSA